MSSWCNFVTSMTTLFSGMRGNPAILMLVLLYHTQSAASAAVAGHALLHKSTPTAHISP